MTQNRGVKAKRPRVEKTEEYHTQAIIYNRALVEATDAIRDQISHPEVLRWVTGVGNNHLHHMREHERALAGLIAPVEDAEKGGVADGE